MPEIDCDFPGGNIVVEELCGNEAFVHQDLRDSAQDWFYWCCRLRAGPGATVRFVFTRSPALGARGPAVSIDRGATWRWLGRSACDGNAFSFVFPADAAEARLSFGMPYQFSDWQRFARRLAGTGHFERGVLCRTRQGRTVEYARVGCINRPSSLRVALTCRHHACEMMANYALEGLLEWALCDAAEDARWLRENVEVLAVPFVDLDGVETGDQGKGRQPRDHGRDYSGASIFAETAALRRLLPAWAEDKLRAALDLHCPWLGGPGNEEIYLVGSKAPAVARKQRRFSELLESAAAGPLPFKASDFLEFGRGWNTAENYDGGKTFADWASELPGAELATAIEIPYANAGGAEVNQQSCRKFGVDLGRGLARYLMVIG